MMYNIKLHYNTEAQEIFPAHTHTHTYIYICSSECKIAKRLLLHQLGPTTLDRRGIGREELRGRWSEKRVGCGRGGLLLLLSAQRTWVDKSLKAPRDSDCRRRMTKLCCV